MVEPLAPETQAAPPPEFDPERILFHGSGLLAVDKPAGLPVHRGTRHPFGLVEAIEEWVRAHPGVLDIKAGRRIRPIHRLDLEASGVLLLGLRRPVARRAKEAFTARSVERRYLAVVAGPVPAAGTLRGRVRSRLRGQYRRLAAEVAFRRLAGDERLSLVEVRPRGGRTHQIRVLFAEAGRPLAGDLRYGKPRPSRQFREKFAVPHQLLHALELTLPREVLGSEMVFRAPLPPLFREVCRQKGWEPALEEP